MILKLFVSRRIRTFLIAAVAILGISGLAFAESKTGIRKVHTAPSATEPGTTTLKDAMNASAAARKSAGKMRGVTGDQRLAAAQRNAARKAAHAKMTGGKS